jgi:1-acyl-sn-glycerol-3-phosphate acyltransferase
MSLTFGVGRSNWEQPTLREILSHPVPELGQGDRWLVRALTVAGRGRVRVVSGLEHVGPANDPFILVLNHSTRRESLLVPALLTLHRGGRLIHFMADWNFRLIPGIGFIYSRAETITVTRKPARPSFLNVLRPLYCKLSVLERGRARLLAGGSVGIFPEARVNRDPGRLLRGRTGAACLSLETGLAIVPAGLRLSEANAGCRSRPTLEIRIGAPLHPPPPTGARARIAELRDWHATAMTEIARLSGKAWIYRGRAGMRHDTGITARRVTDESDRRRVVEILAATYQHEKHWVTDAEAQIPPDNLRRPDIAWLVVTLQDRPAGALRVLYDPPYLQYAAYGLKLLDPSLRVEEFIRNNRIAEVGRFAVRPEFRGQFMVAAALRSRPSCMDGPLPARVW